MPRLGYQILHGGLDDLSDRPDPTIEDAVANVQLQELRARRGKQTEARVDPLPNDQDWVAGLFRDGVPIARIARHTKLTQHKVRLLLQGAGLMEPAPAPTISAAPKPPRLRKRGRALRSLSENPLPRELYGLPPAPPDTGVPDFSRMAK